MQMNIRWIVGVMGAVGAGAVALLGSSLAGAQQQPPKAAPPKPGQQGRPAAPARVKPSAGVPIRSVTDRKVVDAMWKVTTSPARSDPFALLPKERAYEAFAAAQVRAQRVGTFPNYYVERPEQTQPIVTEHQPYRRLAAVLIGESISALIDMGDGRGMQRIRPGQRIQGTEWIVASIDSDKAVLVRIPTSRKRPGEVVVRLESPPRGLPGQAPVNGGGEQQAPPANVGRGRLGM